MAEVAIVVGVGPGIGAACARRFAAGGMTVALAARTPDKLAPLAAETGGRAYGCDASLPADVERLFASVARDLGRPKLVVFNASDRAAGSILDLKPTDVERAWRNGAFAGFLVGQAAARAFADHGGTILFTGATASMRGGAKFAGFASVKFALRAMAQSMARELGPTGIHVAHIVVDGGVRGADRDPGDRGADGYLRPTAIAETYWHLHTQPKNAWTHELDLRPWAEKF